METPSSTRSVTRSQTMAARKVEASDKKSISKQDRSALIDITNDSPIVGLAMGSLKTPSSALSKKRMKSQGRTPGSGEALLRGQVKTLLQKVEEEAELSKIILENRPLFNLQGLIDSPINLAASPTPANTPKIFNLSADAPSSTPVNENLLIPQMVNGMVEEKIEGNIESEVLITRSLIFDFSEKSDCSSELTHQVQVCDDDDASIWSIQVNASSSREDDDEEIDRCTLEEEYCYEDDDEEEDGYGGDYERLVDEVCEGMSKISVKEELPKFEGKHIRFVYNSDEEIEEEECEPPIFSS